MQKFSFTDLFAVRTASSEGETQAPQSAPVELEVSVLTHVGGGLMGPNGTWAAASAVQGPNGTW